MNAVSELPKAITLQQLGEAYGIPEDQLHRVVRLLPEQCKFRLGKRWRVLIDPLTAWIQAGGSLSS